ncbi:YwmB family TATA-box binding protein [Bacillus thermotolerans]|uniref:YwmB family TATA-box binding protein n=2 Tax=Bacillus thermotolerans TaxID=1221996 RepID=A0A0F5HMM2_BACTR|nr:YwmB family TATA-box binding protein [Bacillus thermotolerans]KKB34629.1 hypothetical protein QY95_03840 [Bacillus thermotolerans]KKB34826.1 hypothetical protein QY96_03833 [Bacillus thermotolerans]
MKYILILFTILSIYFSVNFVKSAAHEELYTMAEVIEDENYTIKEWSIYSRKPMGEVKSKAAFYNKVNKIKKKKEEYQWTSIEDVNHHLKLVGIYKNKQEKFVHRVIVTGVNNNEGYKVEVANEVKSYQWNRKNINTVLAKVGYQVNKKSSFYSMKGEADIDNIRESELAKKAKGLMYNLSAIEVESLVEDEFVSLSSLSTRWDNKIKLDKNKEMNLQIAARFNPKNDKLTVTVGTPIITTEY